MSNGQVLEASTGKAPAAQAAPAATVTKADRAVAFASAKPAVVNDDLVGKNKKERQADQRIPPSTSKSQEAATLLP